MRLAAPCRTGGLLARSGLRTARPRCRGAPIVQAVIGPYQYKTRVARLRQKGMHQHEFGERLLQHGSYGDDVMQLQAYLADQGYFSSSDGLSGYFGDATREALQAWQRDQGLRITGVFSEECKWAVLRQQEGALQMAQTQALVAAVASAPPPLPVALVQAQPALATGLMGVAALAAGIAMAGPRLMGRDGLAVKAGVQLLRGAKWTAAATLGMTVAASRVLWGAVSGAASGAYRAAVPPRRAQRPASPAAVAAAAARQAAAAAHQQADYDAVTPAELAARLAAAEEEAELDAEEAAYLAAVAASSQLPKVNKPRRLSEEEVQQRIAVMKGEVSPRSPVPQRPAPRPLPINSNKPADDPIMGSKYGTYYGGQQVREKVKQYLEVDSGVPHNARAGTPAARRLESMGYQMSTRPRNNKQQTAKPAAASAASQPAQQAEAQAVPASAVTVVQLPPPAKREPEPEPFQDVVEAVVVESAPKELLSGTELEKSPEKRGRPVPVVKPGMAAPLALQPGTGAPQSATVAAPQAAPRPVPVVKPQKRATIGDMLRSARADSPAADPYAEPYARVNGGSANGVNGGSANGGGGGSYAVQQQQQPARYPSPAGYANGGAANGSANGGGSGGSFPVNTGSSWAAAANGGGGQGSQQDSAPVKYNPDGSVVLASKPIKLVKPAHLLPKTVGFEQLAEEAQAGRNGQQGEGYGRRSTY